MPVLLGVVRIGAHPTRIGSARGCRRATIHKHGPSTRIVIDYGVERDSPCASTDRPLPPTDHEVSAWPSSNDDDPTEADNGMSVIDRRMEGRARVRYRWIQAASERAAEVLIGAGEGSAVR